GGQQGREWFDEIGSLSVPYTFTKEAYYEHVKGEAWLSAFQAVREKSQNDWILQRQLEYQRVDSTKLRQRYERGYTTAWRKFFGGARSKDLKQETDAVDTLESFSQPNSPFTAIFDKVKSQTTLSEPPVSGGVIAWFKSLMTSKEKANTEVEKSFAALRSFKLEDYLEKLKEVRRRLSDAQGEDWRQVTSLATDERYKRARDEARELLRPLKNNQGSAAVAALLGRPLENIESALGLGGELERDATWKKLFETARGLEARYPFNNNRRDSDVQPDELADYISQLSKFYDTYLRAKLGATPGDYSGSEFSQELVGYFKQMFRLRDALGLTQANGPGFSYTLQVQPTVSLLIRVTIDGQPVNPDGGPASRTLNWPSSGGGVTIDNIQPAGQPKLSENYNYIGPWGLFKMA